MKVRRPARAGSYKLGRTVCGFALEAGSLPSIHVFEPSVRLLWKQIFCQYLFIVIFHNGHAAETLANGFELSMVRRCDWWDLLLCLHARGSEALCQRVVQQLEQRFQEQKPATQQMYLASSLSLCTSIYRYAWCCGCGSHLQMMECSFV